MATRTSVASAVAVVILLAELSPAVVSGECTNKRQCMPPTGDLLIGREHLLTASSTCGVNRSEHYCYTVGSQRKCFICHSNHAKTSHEVQSVIDDGKPNRTWWQSEKNVENVTITFDLNERFLFTHMVVEFEKLKPTSMIIERSRNYGRTWQEYRYFARDCLHSFPRITRGPPRYITDVFCDSDYLNSKNSEAALVYRALPGNLSLIDVNQQLIDEHLTITNIRLRFTKLPTPMNASDDRYYALRMLQIRGTCFCNGHAAHCKPADNETRLVDQMVYSGCDCGHNTEGEHCEKCQSLYNDAPWRPRAACRRCECNGNVSGCRFDAEIYQKSGNVSGGVCQGCESIRGGRHCEICVVRGYMTC